MNDDFPKSDANDKWNAVHKIIADFQKKNALEQNESELKYAQILNAESPKLRANRLTGLYLEWCKRDTWNIYSEAIFLADGRDPKARGNWRGAKENEIWHLVLNCGGHSLSIVNLKNMKPSWSVSPRVWVRWLNEKGYTVPEELKEILFPVQPVTSGQERIAPAQAGRERIKNDRIRKLKEFLFEIDSRAKIKGVEFIRQSIPITKQDFLDIFYQQYPDIEPIKLDAFDGDCKVIKIKFKRGTKSNINNQIRRLFT